MKQKGIFITGTDTNVGKTYVGVQLATALVNSDISVTARKPVETGCPVYDGKLKPSDAEALFNATNQNGTLAQTCPYRFSQSVSPERAARLEGVDLTMLMLAAACRNGVKNKDFLIIEGAGGFYSPLTHDGVNADLASKMSLPVLLVAANRLGCINHVLLTAEAIRNRGLELVAVILNEVAIAFERDMDNADDLSQRLTCPIIPIDYNSTRGITELTRLLV